MNSNELIEEGLKECSKCKGYGYFDNISKCCGARRNTDLHICSECKDHCGPMKCDNCNGEGTVPYTEEDALNDKENEYIGNKEMMNDGD